MLYINTELRQAVQLMLRVRDMIDDPTFCYARLNNKPDYHAFIAIAQEIAYKESVAGIEKPTPVFTQEDVKRVMKAMRLEVGFVVKHPQVVENLAKAALNAVGKVE